MKKILLIVLSAVIALGSGVGVALVKRHQLQTATATTTTVNTSGTVTVTESTTVVVEEEDSKFVVDLGKCRAYDNVSRELLWNSLSKEDRARVKAAGFSDAVSFPLKGMEDEEKIAAIREEILRNPVYGDMVARGFTEVKLSDGTTTLSDINPWIEDFIAKSDKAFKNTTEKGKRGIEIWCETKSDGKYYVTDEYREYASGLATIIDRMVVVGYSSRQSVLHFPLNDAVNDYARRTEKGDKQENKEAFVLQYVRKDGTKIFEIAFNMYDRRFELLGNYAKPAPTTRRSGGTGGEPTTRRTNTTTKPATTKPHTTKPATTKPHTTKPATTKPTPTLPSFTLPDFTLPSLPSTTKSTTTTTRYSKPTQEDPGYQGKAPGGAGSDQTGDGRGNYQTTAQRPPETTTRRVTTTARVTTTVATTASSGVNLDNATPPTTQVIPTVTDSHDTPSSNAGNNNGAFSMG